MKTLIALVFLAASVAACSGKKADTTPKADAKAIELKSDAHGGAAYGGAAYGAAKTPAKSANPCATLTPGS
jgi:hypothetical protein